jgi:FKBP-type peptidyl-prolyl cis-trans isomerase
MQALLRTPTLALLVALMTPIAAWAQDPSPPTPPPTPDAGQDEPQIPADGSDPVTLPSGLIYSVLEPAPEGAAQPGWGANLEVHYTGYLTDGTVFDDSRAAGRTSKFILGRVIEGWNEGLQLMGVGSRYKFTIPPDLAYGEGGYGSIPGNATLIFDVELIGFEAGPELPQRPTLESVEGGAPGDAIQTLESGLRYRVIQPGSGAAPAGDEIFKTHFAFWNANAEGNVIDCDAWGQGPLISTPDRVQLEFIKPLQAVLKAGAVLAVEVPADMGPNANRDLPGLSQGEPSLWRLEVLAVVPRPVLPAYVPIDASQAKTTASGLRYQVLEPGEGAPPTADQSFKVHYTFYTSEGVALDSSLNPGNNPIIGKSGEMSLNFLRELPPLMAPGSVVLADVPVAEVFGPRPPAELSGQATCLWRLELERVLVPLPIPEFREPGEEARTRESGLKIETVAPGTGPKPRPDQRVVVHYVGWLTDGTKFDSSFERGEPSTFGVTQVIPGWQEGLQELRIGEIALLHIPSDLAYGPGGAGAAIPPNADLIFFVQLLEILE